MKKRKMIWVIITVMLLFTEGRLLSVRASNETSQFLIFQEKKYGSVKEDDPEQESRPGQEDIPEQESRPGQEDSLEHEYSPEQKYQRVRMISAEYIHTLDEESVWRKEASYRKLLENALQTSMGTPMGVLVNTTGNFNKNLSKNSIKL